jgi:uncharacterized protein (DUF1697 family)
VTTFVALLRSVNVGGRNKVAMADLRALAESLGFGEVATYVQSGNLVLAGPGSASAVGTTLEGAVAERLGVSVRVLVRTKAQLNRVVDRFPFPEPDAAPTAHHVAFFDAVPDPAAVHALVGEAEQRGSDRITVAGSEAFLHCPDGYADSTLTNAVLERRLGVTATTRNWRTVSVLAGMVGITR